MNIQTFKSADSSNQITVKRAASTSAKLSAGTAQPVAPAATEGSTISLSSTAAFSSHASDIDTAKVESIKAALRDGTYKIDSAAVADGMLGTARDLLPAASR
ncbi:MULTISPECIES: flagellar biosynthesis anti-sigma factor FlgM [unclassified Caballeronia]|uniref:flagellar biosynthesis anti-sigma factor FlgM n=1 Tax=unclassified Caballeronia TaxID=2646786 RepID=UPI00158F3907|nr:MULTISPECIES: flagellar biosynthesis anti-sigma factor FlgM [unclassified Caballeronia]QSN64025.1 flagellar biosynthesis anti-sigma factor FlgM [Caballeronia sp. M1242]